MNWQHLRALVWLRWRLTLNLWRRAGRVNAVLMIVFAVGALATAIPLFLGCFALAVNLIPRAAPAYLMYAWDGLVAAFLFFWIIGLVTELQRSDPLSLSKFMHLPVSVNGAFLINYLSSLARLSLLFFGPPMLAFALALVYVQGAAQLAAPALLAAFLLMVTALTYQFQGWLASLMNNPRRRRSVMVATTAAFILVFQLPSLINLYLPRQVRRQAERRAAWTAETKGFQDELARKKIDIKEYQRKLQESMVRYRATEDRADREEMARLQGMVRTVNMAVPLGWLPLGVMDAARGRAAAPLLGLAGMTLIGAFSLWRAYRTTVNLYQGQPVNRKGRAPAPRAEEARQAVGGIMEARLPGVSEPASAVALAGLKSVLRSPEAKMALLTPIIMGGVFGMMVFGNRHDVPTSARPLLGVAAIAFVLFGMLQLMANQFGADRDGFRVFVLSAAPRGDIILGKNLAYAPIALGLSLAFLAAVQVLCPMRADHALAMAPQFVSMFLLFCIMANLISIYAPVYMPGGSMKPTNPKLTTILIQLALVFLLFPLVQGLTLIPLGVETGLRALGWAKGVPVCLLLTLAGCAAVCLLYLLSLGWLGALLQARERKILETVTNRAL